MEVTPRAAGDCLLTFGGTCPFGIIPRAASGKADEVRTSQLLTLLCAGPNPKAVLKRLFSRDILLWPHSLREVMAPRHSALMLLCRDLGVTGVKVTEIHKMHSRCEEVKGPAFHITQPLTSTLLDRKRADGESDFLEVTWPPRSIDGSAACHAWVLSEVSSLLGKHFSMWNTGYALV